MYGIYSETNAQKAIQQIIDKFDEEEPFYLINIDDITKKYEDFQEVLPRVNPFYAVKCNDDPTILKVLVTLGIGFDCATKNEIHTMLSLGVSPNQIIYANTIKRESHVRYAASVNVETLTVDSVSELHKIKETYPAAKLVIRISYDDQSCLQFFGEKFGCHSDNEAFELLRVANSLQLNIIGVSFHVGSGCHDYTCYTHAIAMASRVFSEGKSIGFDMTLLDIGGGFPGTNQIEFRRIGKIINDALDKYFSGQNVQIIAEPGRYFVESAVTFACRIISMRKRNENISYYLNDGRCGSFSNINFFNEPFELKILKDLENIELYSSIIYGPTCWGDDIVEKSIYLPQLQVNDWLYVENFGAYRQVLFTTFNGFPKPKIYSICSTKKWNLLKSNLHVSENKVQEHGTCIIVNNI